LTLSMTSITERLKTQSGRDFALAVLDAFKYLGFEVEDIEVTQGTQAHSDLIVKAHLATHPYFAVIECTAVRDGRQVDYTKLYQLGSNAPRYATKYSKEYPSASYKMLVGRPDFSQDARKLAQDIGLLKAQTLEQLLWFHERLYLSQDDLEPLFQTKGEISIEEVMAASWGMYRFDAKICALVYLTLLNDPTDKTVKRRKEWMAMDALIAMVRHWLWLIEDIKSPVPDFLIKHAISELSSTLVRALLVDEQKIMISSLPFENAVRNMGQLGVFFKDDLMVYIDKAERVKQSTKTQMASSPSS